MAALALGLYVVMFVVVFVVRSRIQKRLTGDSGVRAGVLAAKPWTVDWFAGWLLVLAVIAGVAAPIAGMAGLEPLFEVGAALGSVGAGVTVIGIALCFASQVNMGESWRVGIDEGERTDLVTTGAFGVVRNPIFSALIIAAAGLALMVPNLIALVGIVGLVVAIELQVRFVEEPYLLRSHPGTYAAYGADVGRFVPRLGRLR